MISPVGSSSDAMKTWSLPLRGPQSQGAEKPCHPRDCDTGGMVSAPGEDNRGMHLQEWLGEMMAMPHGDMGNDFVNCDGRWGRWGRGRSWTEARS